MSSLFPGSRASAHTVATWEDKCLHSEYAPFPLLPLVFMAEHDVRWCGISLWSVGFSCPSCVPWQPLACPQPTHWAQGSTEKDLICASTVQPKHQHVTNAVSATNPKRSNTWAAVMKIKTILSRPSTTKVIICLRGWAANTQ